MSNLVRTWYHIGNFFINKVKYNQVGEHINLKQSSEMCQQGEKEKKVWKLDGNYLGKLKRNVVLSLLWHSARVRMSFRACISRSLANLCPILDFSRKPKGILHSSFWVFEVYVMWFYHSSKHSWWCWIWGLSALLRTSVWDSASSRPL